MTCSVDTARCIRCAACATVAPEHFAVAGGKARVTRAPATATELRACAAAATLCPTQAISVGAVDAETPVTAAARPELYRPVSEVAEAVRWKQTDLPWKTFDPTQLHGDVLRDVVREMAFSEQTTFSATQRFMTMFSDDADFSQWISVWFFEETRHPMVLLRWLELAGEKPGAEFVQKGRVSAPFMKSRIGTLVTNVISEMFAAEAYRGMATSSPEPLLAFITERISADEARHGATFFAYARRVLETSTQPERDRLDVLKVLHFWVNENSAVSHPVNQTMEKLASVRTRGGILPPFEPPLGRVSRMVGLLTGLPIQRPEDLSAQLFAHTAKVHAEANV
jgi:ferredoxin